MMMMDNKTTTTPPIVCQSVALIADYQRQLVSLTASLVSIEDETLEAFKTQVEALVLTKAARIRAADCELAHARAATSVIFNYEIATTYSVFERGSDVVRAECVAACDGEITRLVALRDGKKHPRVNKKKSTRKTRQTRHLSHQAAASGASGSGQAMGSGGFSSTGGGGSRTTGASSHPSHPSSYPSSHSQQASSHHSSTTTHPYGTGTGASFTSTHKPLGRPRAGRMFPTLRVVLPRGDIETDVKQLLVQYQSVVSQRLDAGLVALPANVRYERHRLFYNQLIIQEGDEVTVQQLARDGRVTKHQGVVTALSSSEVFLLTRHTPITHVIISAMDLRQGTATLVLRHVSSSGDEVEEDGY